MGYGVDTGLSICGEVHLQLEFFKLFVFLDI